MFTPSPFDGARLAAQVSKLCPQESDEERATKKRVADHIGKMGLIDYCAGACWVQRLHLVVTGATSAALLPRETC